MGDIVTASGTRVFVGPAVSTTLYNSLANFQGITAWTEVGLVESVGEIGDESQPITFEALGDGRVRKSKGARDAGTFALVCAHDPLDTGQAAMEAAEQTNDNYAFKMVLPDGPVGYNDTVLYFAALVMGRRRNIGNNANVIRRNYNVGINTSIFEDPASV